MRFVNGSKAVGGTGSVDVIVDGTNKFAGVAFGAVTNYLSVGSGSHSVTIYPAGNDSGTPVVSNQTFSVNGTNFETLALGGATTPTFYAFSDQVFSGSYSGFGAVNFYNISPASGGAGIQFGYYTNPQTNPATPSITALGSVITPGSESGPVAIPTGVAIGFGAAPAGSVTAAATLLPSTVSPQNCAANTFACDSGLISVFYTDGPKLTGIFSATNT